MKSILKALLAQLKASGAFKTSTIERMLAYDAKHPNWRLGSPHLVGIFEQVRGIYLAARKEAA